MASVNQNSSSAQPVDTSGAAKPDDPEWTTGLKRLYDSVVDEPLPDSFRDLLAKLDSGHDT